MIGSSATLSLERWQRRLKQESCVSLACPWVVGVIARLTCGLRRQLKPFGAVIGPTGI